MAGVAAQAQVGDWSVGAQMNFGSTEFSTVAAKRVPKFVVDQDRDIRKIRLGTRPLAAPKNYCPYIYAANAVN